MDTVIRAIINAKYERCVARVVHRLRRISSRGWQADDAPERTLWDHWKREMQDEHSLLYSQLEAVVEDIVFAMTEALPHDDGSLLTLGTRALDDREGEPLKPIFVPEAVAAELLRRVNSRAYNEPHRPAAQRLLDEQAHDRFTRDMER